MTQRLWSGREQILIGVSLLSRFVHAPEVELSWMSAGQFVTVETKVPVMFWHLAGIVHSFESPHQPHSVFDADKQSGHWPTLHAARNCQSEHSPEATCAP